MNNFWSKYPDIQIQLNDIKSNLSEFHKTGEKYLTESFDYLMQTGGKMLRPAFVLIGALMKEHDEHEKISNAAVAIETLHMATLIHDDIIDDAKMRRNQLSIQAKYSKEYAVYMGDYLFTRVFMILAKYDYTRENLYDISKGISKICIGEMMQNRLRYHNDVSTKDYLKIIAGKTAALFAVSLGLGGHLAGVSEKDAKNLGRIGYNVGMAFQIKDDLLDYSSKNNVVGKDTLSDLANGYYTLPVIYALKAESSNNLIKILDDQDIKEEDVMKAIHIIKNSGSIQKTEALADRYTKRAMKAIEDLPSCRTKDILRDLVPILLDRKH
ncbi:MAG: polyprenyl synthetase family protein [Clostridia bacterium]|nr:polyprenyl synthetase family protein [Clostridia bacterium]